MIAVVILTYRAEDGVFDRCLESVVASADADRIVVVDNGQTLAREQVDAIATRSGAAAPTPVDLLSTAENLGFAGGMNAGISHALSLGAEAIAILNDDTVVECGWLGVLVRALDGGRVGAVQPKLLLAGTGAPADPPVINSVGMRVRGDGAGIDVGFGEPDLGQYEGVAPIDLFTGGALLLHAEFLREVGGFDERYFLYYEDIDLARRGTAAGWTYVVEPASVVHHAFSLTAKQVPGLHRYWQERNRLWWLFRHGRPTEIARGLILSLGRLAKHPTRPQAHAVRDGIRGWRRCRRERRAGRIVVHPLPHPPPVPWTLR